MNLTAFDAKLMRIWPSRSESPRRSFGSFGSTSTISSRPLATAFSWMKSVTLPITFSSSKSTDSTLMRPDSIFEKSRMSLMTPSRCWPARWIFET